MRQKIHITLGEKRERENAGIIIYIYIHDAKDVDGNAMSGANAGKRANAGRVDDDWQGCLWNENVDCMSCSVSPPFVVFVKCT